ncbi:Hint domain-containing protein [Mesobaculum littorinae]|uniref:Hint domain-containing protein n=1 Tax=Mesobaculum littorinae TaxID=2486419 RepID=A0A438AJK0_9RHOB|nr:Hint domain-containing protein [Mesobaculum littorinae]RVV98834.1 Hint domain-containing protein [Mesobaculum littorinae]
MRDKFPDAADPAQSLPVYDAACFTVIDGANLGDPVTDAADLIAGDVYTLAPRSKRRRLSVHTMQTPRGDGLTVSPATECGSPGSEIHLDCCLTFMSPDGRTVEALVFVETDDEGMIAGTWLFPLAKILQKQTYALVSIDTRTARARFAETACVSFTRGTHITMGSGRQVPIEDLQPGDAVLTRDHGVQKVRWIGQQTVRASGDFAPIRIAAGALNNAGDLIVSPNHRLFVYQRHDAVRAGRAEVLVKAKYLVNGDTVTRTDGGFVDYFQLLFDRHEIIYAEGIAAESLMVDPTTSATLPAELREALPATDASAAGRMGVELGEGTLRGRDTVDLLRRASSG